MLSRTLAAGPLRLKYHQYKYLTILLILMLCFLLSETLWHWLLPTADGSGLQTPTKSRHVVGLYVLLVFGFVLGCLKGGVYSSAFATIGKEPKIVSEKKSVT